MVEVYTIGQFMALTHEERVDYVLRNRIELEVNPEVYPTWTPEWQQNWDRMQESIRLHKLQQRLIKFILFLFFQKYFRPR
jgi:hypothetical protein